MKTVDITERYGEPGELFWPICPLCDNEILEHEPCVIVVAHESKSLAHALCVEEME